MNSYWKVFRPEASILIQGITGKEGLRMARWLSGSGANVCAGVTPGKGGQDVEGCPVFNSVKEALASFPGIEATGIVVPAPYVKSAVQEALAAGIKHLYVLTESVPVHDVLALRAQAEAAGARILGPSSVGYLQFPRFRIGYIGGEDPFKVVKEGGIGLVSTSGGMVNEIMMGLAAKDIGIRMAFAVGGDRVPAFSLEEAVAFCDAQETVERIVVFTEPGRPFFQRLLKNEVVTRHPLAVFLAGDVLDDLPRGKAYGHTGTLLQEEEQGVADLRAALRQRGIACVATMPELIQHLTSHV